MLAGHGFESARRRTRVTLITVHPVPARRARQGERVGLDPGASAGADDVANGSRSLSEAAAAPSVSRMPACALTISPSAQNVKPSP